MTNIFWYCSLKRRSANPTIVSVLRAHRGNTIDLAGKKLKEILPQLKREIIDVEVEVSFKGSASKAKKAEIDGTFEIYNPRGGTPKVKETFRLVGVFDKESKKYHLYLTNITPEQLPAEDVALLYSVDTLEHRAGFQGTEAHLPTGCDIQRGACRGRIPGTGGHADPGRKPPAT